MSTVMITTPVSDADLARMILESWQNLSLVVVRDRPPSVRGRDIVYNQSYELTRPDGAILAQEALHEGHPKGFQSAVARLRELLGDDAALPDGLTWEGLELVARSDWDKDGTERSRTVVTYRFADLPRMADEAMRNWSSQ